MLSKKKKKKKKPKLKVCHIKFSLKRVECIIPYINTIIINVMLDYTV